MKIAAFIDCENIPAMYAEQILTTLTGEGDVVLCQGYADFTNPFYRGWQDSFARIGGRAIQVFHNTKDGADGEILIDATVCAIQEPFLDAVCIVSNDGIYHALKRVLHKHGKKLYVVGTTLASRVLEDAADTFTRLEGDDPRATAPEDIVAEVIARNGGQMRLSELGNSVWGLLPNYKALGFKGMREYIASLGFDIVADTSFDPPIDWVQGLTR